MRLSAFLAFTLAATASAADELQVKLYEGPTECEDSEKVKDGHFVFMHYTGTIHETSKTGEKGAKFDSSRDRGETFDFQIGSGQVIKGWDEGLMGLCKGSKATLIIPPEMGYGDAGSGDAIPGGATLNFDVEVVEISEHGPYGPNIFKIYDVNEDNKLSKDELNNFFIDQGHGEMPDGLWESEDQDGDGFITFEEFNGPKGPPEEEF